MRKIFGQTARNEETDAILAAAVMAAAADVKCQSEPDHKKNAERLRDAYEAYREVGFTEEQAMQIICAILH